MENSTVRNFLIVTFMVVLLSPYLILLAHIEDWHLGDVTDVWAAIKFTVLQATLSSAVSMVVGGIGAMGLMALRGQTKNFASGLFLLPNFLPSLFVILSSMLIFKPFPFGVTGIVLIHVCINSGLVAVVLASIAETKLGKFAELALLEGASRLLFLRKVALPVLAHDIGILFLFVFAICFASFSVPLMAGSTTQTVLEVLIYEKIKMQGAWGQALGLSAINVFIFLGLAHCLRNSPTNLEYRFRNLSLLKWKPGNFLLAGISIALLAAPLFCLSDGFTQFLALSEIHGSMVELFLSSLIVALGVGSLVGALVLFFYWLSPNDRWQKLVLIYSAPTAVVTGFAILLMGRIEHPMFVYFRLMFGLMILLFPVVYRLRGFIIYQSLKSQIQAAETLGASKNLIFRKIVFPQVVPTVGFLAGIAAFWASGDFAISTIVAEQDITLALLVQGLLSNYRLEVAGFLVFPLLLIGIAAFLIFWSMGNVFSQKSQA